MQSVPEGSMKTERARREGTSKRARIARSSVLASLGAGLVVACFQASTGSTSAVPEASTPLVDGAAPYDATTAGGSCAPGGAACTVGETCCLSSAIVGAGGA